MHMHQRIPQVEERVERQISAFTSLSLCALTVLAQIGLSFALTHFLEEKASYVYALLLLAGILLGVMNAGITLYFLNLACGQPAAIRDLFYGFKTDSKQFLVISAAMMLCQAVCLYPGQYLSQNYLTTWDIKWLLYALAAMAAGCCLYVPVSLGIAMSFYLMLDFPQNSGRETLALCWRIMKGQRKRLFILELGFLPLMLLCILSFGIGFLWLEPYMQMT